MRSLRELWAGGLSASQIATLLGHGITRNAVIAKIHRLRLSKSESNPPSRRGSVPVGPRKKRKAPVAAPTPRRTKPAWMVAVEMLPPLLETEEIVVPPGERKKLLDLEDRDCRWPIGDPRDDAFHFCGQVRMMGMPYCVHHVRRAYQPVQKRPMPPMHVVQSSDEPREREDA